MKKKRRKKSEKHPHHQQPTTPTCSHPKTTVEKTLTTYSGNTSVIHRIRKCKTCKKRFRTREELED